MLLRTVAIAGQAAAIAVALALGVRLRVVPMAIVIGALVIANLVVSARLKRAAPATHLEVAAHLLRPRSLQRAAARRGRHQNPFALLYLLHVVLIAMLLPWRLALGGTLAVVASFALAFAAARPLRVPAAVPCRTPRWRWASARASP